MSESKTGEYSDNRVYKPNLLPEEENKILKATLDYLKHELDRLKKPPLLVCEVKKVMGDKAIVKLSNGNHFVVTIMGELVGKLKSKDIVLADQKTLAIVDKIDQFKKFDVETFVLMEKPNISWESLGGLDEQINEIREVIELPLKKPELFEQIGITPPRGILLYGPSGTGKTLLAKAVAASTNVTFIEVVGSELVQKFIGEGAKLVKEIFKLAREKAPSIIFIDELDAIAANRVDLGASGEREVQRTFMQLLAEIDGFKSLDNVKIIGATNRPDILDGAILRAGRLDRLIEVPIPALDGRKEIFKIHINGMNIGNINVSELVSKTDGFSGAKIKAVCTEAGYFAIRENSTKVEMHNFFDAITKLVDDEEEDLRMFG